MLDSEKKIIENAKAGEASAFGQLYDNYHVQIYRFIYLKVSHREEAEDLTQQVFLNAWQNMPSYQDKGFPFSSWLYQIARNKVIDHYRTKKPVLDIEDLEELSSTDNFEKSASDNFDLNLIRKAVLKLKPHYQDIIVMRFIEDLTPREVARAMKKPETTIRVMQHRALKELKKEIEKMENGE